MRSPTPAPTEVEKQDCARKRRYATAGEAQRMAEHRRDESGHADIDIYPCRVCRGWHLGHSTPRRPGRL